MNTDRSHGFYLSVFIRGNPWLLLRDAMDRAHAPDQWFAIDRYHSTTREELLQGFHRASVIRVTEHGSEHDVVGDVKVCVAGGQTFEVASVGARTANDAWHW